MSSIVVAIFRNFDQICVTVAFWSKTPHLHNIGEVSQNALLSQSLKCIFVRVFCGIFFLGNIIAPMSVGFDYPKITLVVANYGMRETHYLPKVLPRNLLRLFSNPTQNNAQQTGSTTKPNLQCVPLLEHFKPLLLMLQT